jgi:hypothetical protein
MRLSNVELISIIEAHAERLCIFYISKEGGHLEALDLSNPVSTNGHAIQLNGDSTADVHDFSTTLKRRGNKAPEEGMIYVEDLEDGS